ncbi:hypothetical protein D3C87_1394850 [compost metagenome]
MLLIEHLSIVEEIRSDINLKHDLVDVIFLVISAIMAGAEGWRESRVLLPLDQWYSFAPWLFSGTSSAHSAQCQRAALGLWGRGIPVHRARQDLYSTQR